MKIIHWLFVLSVALFVSGIGFVIVGARAARQTPAVDRTASRLVPVASVKQIMSGIVTPAARVVFASVGTVISFKGVDETAPQDDEEWEAVGNSAAALIESGNLMLMGSRAVDNGEWVKHSQALIDAAKVALKATQEKNTEALFDSGEGINESCDACHLTYQRGS